MNILHVIDSEGMYGAEIVVLNLLEAQARTGHHPSLLSLGNTGVGQKAIESEASSRGVDTCALRFKNGFNIRGSLRIVEHAKTLNTKLVHSHGYKSDILLGILPRKRRDFPILSTLHGWTSTSVLSKMWLYESMQAIMLKRLDKVVAVSTSIEKRRRLKCLHVEPVIIHNGIPRLNFEGRSFSSEITHCSEQYRNGLRIISIGRLSAEKGFDVLIRAIAILVTKEINVGLALVGDGPELSALKQLAEDEKIGNRVFFPGYLDKAFRFIPDFHLFVLPSYTEGLPITLLEAMQAGVPIVATNVGEVPIVLGSGEFGRIVEPGDPMQLAQAVAEIWENMNEAKNKAGRAKTAAIRQFGTDRMAQQYDSLYEELISQKVQEVAHK
jgi:glycosyltransferase involved in cell wall biosynthesis